MTDRRSILRAEQIASEIEKTRDIVAHTLNVLRTPMPDTFLGRPRRDLIAPPGGVNKSPQDRASELAK